MPNPAIGDRDDIDRDDDDGGSNDDDGGDDEEDDDDDDDDDRDDWSPRWLIMPLKFLWRSDVAVY